MSTQLTLHDCWKVSIAFAIMIATYPFAFECAIALVAVSDKLREALNRARMIWQPAVLLIIALSAISDEVSRLLIYNNLFALFSTEAFLASRLESTIERYALQLSFACVLLLAHLDAKVYQARPSRSEAVSRRALWMLFATPLVLMFKWNHFVAPLSFVPTTIGRAGFSMFETNPTTHLMIFILGAWTFLGGGLVAHSVRLIRAVVTR